MEWLTQTVTIINEVLNWLAVNVPWELVIASGVLSPVLLGVKKWKHIKSEKIMSTLVIVFGLLGAAATYILSSTSDTPAIIATQGLLIAAMSQPWYFTLWKPISKWLSAELAKARAFDAEVKSAAIPATGLPVSNQQ